jgi:hypothetical protein
MLVLNRGIKTSVLMPSWVQQSEEPLHILTTLTVKTNIDADFISIICFKK